MDSQNKNSAEENRKLFVGNIPWSIRSEDLRALFEEYGEIEDAVVIIDRATNRSKGFGFITFVNAQDAQKAMSEMNEKEVEGRNIIVSAARPRENRYSDRPRQ